MFCVQCPNGVFNPIEMGLFFWPWHKKLNVFTKLSRKGFPLFLLVVFIFHIFHFPMPSRLNFVYFSVFVMRSGRAAAVLLYYSGVLFWLYSLQSPSSTFVMWFGVQSNCHFLIEIFLMWMDLYITRDFSVYSN